MIELSDGIFIAPEHVSLIKKIDEKSCLLFTVGQSALDGHLLPYDAAEVAEVVNDALENVEYDEDEEESD